MMECLMERNCQLCSYWGVGGSKYGKNLVGNILGGVPELGYAPFRRGFTSLTFLTSSLLAGDNWRAPGLLFR